MVVDPVAEPEPLEQAVITTATETTAIAVQLRLIGLPSSIAPCPPE